MNGCSRCNALGYAGPLHGPLTCSIQPLLDLHLRTNDSPEVQYEVKDGGAGMPGPPVPPRYTPEAIRACPRRLGP